MSMKLIVGDRLEKFAQATGSLTFTQFLLSRLAPKQCVATGQGLNPNQVELLERYCRQHDIKLVRSVDPGERAGESLTHKADQRNGLISEPVMIAPDVFEAQLLIDEHNELLIDHVTGYHVQGMVLIEAIRQMFIAVSEVGYSREVVPRNGYVIFSSLDVRFSSFVFPIPAILRHTTTSLRVDAPGRTTFAATLEVIQNSACVTAAEVAYTVFDKAVIGPKELRKAKQALKTFTEDVEQLATDVSSARERRDPSSLADVAFPAHKESA